MWYSSQKRRASCICRVAERCLDFESIEELDRGCWHQEAYNLPLLKTLHMVFIVEFEWVAKIGFLIGNDIETSEVLYSALLNPKNADFKCKGSELVWIIIIVL